ncbi:probable enoyl-CoA hydratase 1, peroxisomal, partial [Ananas comosus]|uniref:Probable enoyl-CoA hydratase 1, peroxisomal n=1 Tax=Ananas comosus TaxID=4615 RepID=A0A6P5EER7_ANACO
YRGGAATHGSAVAVVTINRLALAGAFRRLDADDTVAVVVLAGRGHAFCSGVDLTAAEDVFKGDIKDPAADPIAAMVAYRKPIVGAIAGFTVTAGFEIALACDLLVAGRDAEFADPYAAEAAAPR